MMDREEILKICEDMPTSEKARIALEKLENGLDGYVGVIWEDAFCFGYKTAMEKSSKIAEELVLNTEGMRIILKQADERMDENKIKDMILNIVRKNTKNLSTQYIAKESYMRGFKMALHYYSNTIKEYCKEQEVT